MSNVTSLSAFKKLQSHKNIRMRQVFCPVAKITAHTSPLTVGDDLSLRTMITSPDLYDRELAMMIYDHCTFPDLQKHPTFDQFINTLSVFDRRAILWGIFSSTYEKFDQQEIICPNCKHNFKDVVRSKDLLSADMVEVWDKDKTFTNYLLEIPIEINENEDSGLKSIIFSVCIPTIKHHFDVLKLVSPQKMKENFDKFGQILSQTEELVLITNQIDIQTIEAGEVSTDSICGINDIHNAVSNYITFDITNIVVDKYREEFVKFNPVFKKNYDCSNCGHNFDNTIDLELALFRNFLRL